jgi:hypothetical protein
VSEQEHVHPPQEPDWLSWKWITGVTIGTIALTIILSVIAAWAVYYYRDSYGAWASPEELGAPLPELPANTELEYYLFEEDELGEGQRRRAGERQWLESWGWADDESGRVRVPIDEAIDIVAQEGS